MPGETPTFYKKPYLGQPFIRREEDEKPEYAMCNGLTITGQRAMPDGSFTDTWIATIESRLTHGAVFYDNTPVSSGDWRPLTDKELADLRGSAFGDVVSKAAFEALREDAHHTIASLERSVTALEARVAENQTLLAGALGAIARLENPSAPTPTPAPPPPTNGATTRVPRVPAAG